MQDSIIKSEKPSEDFINGCLKSVLGLSSDINSSDESLLTLLNTSIEHQQVQFKLLNERTFNISKNKINMDAELEKIITSGQEESRKKKKKKDKHHEIEVGTLDHEGLPKKHKKKKKQKQSSMSEVEEDSKHKKSKKKKRKESDLSEMEYVRKLKSTSPVYEELNKKSKKKKHKHSISEDTNQTISENDTPIKIKKEKKHKHSAISEQIKDNGQEIKYSSISETEDNPETSTTERKRRHSISEENYEKTIPENDSPTKKIKSHKNSSTEEPDNNLKKKPKRQQKKLIRVDSILINKKNNHEKNYLRLDNEGLEDPSTSRVRDFINESLDLVSEKSQLNDSDITLLTDLYITIPWELPPSHTIETRLSHPTSEQYKEFKELEYPMKSGPYNKEEDQKIKDNWGEFCKDHDLNVSPLLFFPMEGDKRSLLSSTERIKFVRYLGKGLQNRTLSSIYNRFQLLFGSNKKGKWTPEEDNIILTFFENSNVPNKYAVLGKILNRGRELVRKRHDLLKSEDEKLHWDMPLLQDLTNKLLEVTENTDVEDLKDFSIEPVHWKKIGKMMGISPLKIRRKWLIYLYPRFFIDEYNTLNEIREKLIEILYESKETDRRKLDWKKLAENFDGITHARLYKIFLDMVTRYVPNIDFKEAVITLHSMLPHLRLQNKMLEKFMHRDGELFDTKILEPIVSF